MKRNRENRGFMALVSVIIISAALILIASTLSFTGFASRYNVLDSEYKEKSFFLAWGCLDKAILELKKSSFFYGDLPNVAVGSDFCSIERFNPSANPITIRTGSIFGRAVTNLEIKLIRSDLSISSWQEL